jgi:hypothetical protein
MQAIEGWRKCLDWRILAARGHVQLAQLCIETRADGCQNIAINQQANGHCIAASEKLGYAIALSVDGLSSHGEIQLGLINKY